MTTTGRFQFKKSERIVSQKVVGELFSGDGSHSQAAFPVRAVYYVGERSAGEPPVQLLISVPKRRFKHAVDRNRVKRQLREAYRHHRQLLEEAVVDGRAIKLALIWIGDRHCPSADVEARVVGLFNRIAHRL